MQFQKLQRGRRHPCADCGKPMIPGGGSLPLGQGTCRDCRRVRREAKPRWEPAELTCRRCGAHFVQSSAAHLAYCGPGCRTQPNKTLEQRGGRNTYAWQKLRRQVIAKESHCWLCGVEVNKSLPYPMRASPSVDHVVPVRAGGAQHDRENLRLAHLSCNQRRKNPAYARVTAHGEIQGDVRPST